MTNTITTGDIQGIGIAIGTGASVVINGDIHYYPVTLQAPLRMVFAPLIEARLRIFGGRTGILEQLMQRIADPHGSYTVLTAPAGFGKTALMAALVGTTPQAFAYHFFTDQYGSDGLNEIFFLRNVVQQLASWHGHTEAVPTDLAELRALYQSFIDQPLPHTRVLVLDGLDEVTTWSLAAYLSRRLPERLHIIATVRDVGQNWQQFYKIPGDQLMHLPLGGLDDDALKELFQQAGPAGRVLANNQAVLNQVSKLAAFPHNPALGADPFYVRLLVEDLRDERVTVATIGQQPHGLDAYLDEWWQAIFNQATQAGIRDLIGTLTVALGPIARMDLEALHPSLVDSWDANHFQRVLQPVRRFVMGDDQTGYALVHPRLRSYLLGRIKIAGYEQQLLAFCAHWATHQSMYALRYYPRHLEQQPDQLRTLLCTFAWIDARLTRLGLLSVYEGASSLPGDGVVSMVYEALRRSAQVLVNDPSQLAGQLLGRLQDRTESDIQALCQQALHWHARAWLRPLQRTLVAPDDPFRYTLAGHAHTPRMCTLSPDQRWAASADNSYGEPTVRLWDLSTGTLRKTLERVGTVGSTALCFSSDGNLCMIGDGPDLLIWNTITMTEHRRLSGIHTSQIVTLAYAHGRAVSTSLDGLVVLWDAIQWQPIQLYRTHNVPTQIVLNAEGTVLVGISQAQGTVAERQLFYWPLEMPEPAALVVLPGLFSISYVMLPLAVSRDSQRVYAGSPLSCWEPASNQITPLWQATADDRPVAVLLIESQQTERVLTLTTALDPYRTQHALTFWDVSRQTRLQEIPGQSSAITTLCLLHDSAHATSDFILLVGHNDHFLRVWSLAEQPSPSDTQAARPARTGWPTLSSDGSIAIIESAQNPAEYWSMQTGQPVIDQSIISQVAAELQTIQASRRNTFEHAHVWLKPRYHVEKRKQRLTRRDWARQPAWDGKRLVIPGVHHVSFSTADVRERYAISHLRFHDKGAEYEEQGSSDPYFRLWLWDRQQPDAAPHELDSHSLPVLTALLTPDEHYAASAGSGRVIRVWDTQTAQQVWVLRGHTDIIWALAASTAQPWLVSACEDRTVRLWDIQRGQCLAVYTADHPMRQCVISADGQAIVGVDSLGGMHLLRVVAARGLS